QRIQPDDIRSNKPNLALRLGSRRPLLPVVTPEAPLLPGGRFLLGALERQNEGSTRPRKRPPDRPQAPPCHQSCTDHASRRCRVEARYQAGSSLRSLSTGPSDTTSSSKTALISM